MISKRCSRCRVILVAVLVAVALLWPCVSASEEGKTDVPGTEGTVENTEEAGEESQPFQVSFVPQLSLR